VKMKLCRAAGDFGTRDGLAWEKNKERRAKENQPRSRRNNRVGRLFQDARRTRNLNRVLPYTVPPPESKGRVWTTLVTGEFERVGYYGALNLRDEKKG